MGKGILDRMGSIRVCLLGGVIIMVVWKGCGRLGGVWRRGWWDDG